MILKIALFYFCSAWLKKQVLFFMSISKRNVLTHGLSGMLGDMIVFRQKGTQTIVAVAPIKGKKATPSAAQLKVRDRFKLAVDFAKAAIKDPALKKLYAAKATSDQTAYNIALADYFKAPEILSFGSDKYTGKVGDIISPSVSDLLEAKSVQVRIEKADGTLIEQGAAVVREDKLHWDYTVTQANAPVTGSKITVTATDIPGNIAVKQVVLL
jgi:hypothetical protein